METDGTKITSLSVHAHWFGVTYPNDRPAVVKALQTMHDSGKYPQKLS